MHIDFLKSTKRFLKGAKLKCLAGKFQLSGLDCLTSTTIAIKCPKSGCNVFLVGGDGVRASAWHQVEIEHLKAGSATLVELKAILENHVGRIMTPAERRQSGLNPVVELIVTDVVMDDIRKLVFLSFKSIEMDIDEHGLVAVLENTKWRLEDDGYVSSYIQAAECPEDKFDDSRSVSLSGRWTIDEQATTDLLRAQGDSEAFIRMSLNNLRGTEWTISESKLLQKHPNYLHEYKLVSVVTKQGICHITVDFPGLIAPEVWKVKIKANQMIGAGCVLRRAE